nr:MAG TPA: hypothetical protein [Caudoviricetes sp.]DAQ13981.1 MAG TPA: hypothetical protein [Caudoviricetes sp.]DAS74221.1 MAG TPA: hypothetical protein [Caudoviricetes sp.]
MSPHCAPVNQGLKTIYLYRSVNYLKFRYP